MLRVNVNKNQISSHYEKLSLKNVVFVDYVDDVDNRFFGEKVIIKCETDNINKVSQGDYITLAKTFALQYLEHTFSDEVKINYLDKTSKLLSVEVDKYMNVPEAMLRCVRNVYVYKDKDGKEVTKITYDVIISFNDIHYFDINETNCTLYFLDTYMHKDDTKNKKLYQIQFNSESKTDVKLTLDDINDLSKECCQIVHLLIDADKLKKFTNGEAGSEILTNLERFVIRRDTPFRNERFDLFALVVNNSVALPIPISLSFDTNLTQDEILNEVFVEDEKEKAINRIIDVEKDVYYPSIYKYDIKDGYVFVKDVFEVIFNLHFREHRGKDWLVDRESFWNGVKKEGSGKNAKFTLNKTISNSDKSDLLTFLNFTNDDVKFQKNKLKKSFLRLSFYDSDNPLNNNLLAYSTVYFNTGELFSKYVRHFNTEGYTTIIAKDEAGSYDMLKDVVGIRVDREYNGALQNSLLQQFKDNEGLKPKSLAKAKRKGLPGNIEGGGINFDDINLFELFNPLLKIEQFRLSSQFLITGKNMSSSSSEGFYLYLWRENETHIPQDIYMKVEFNHAGFGRVIPFMAPFEDASLKAGSGQMDGKFKTFTDIINDFSGKDAKPYTLADYNKYSYIKLKYCYNKDLQKHYYFIDPKRYGSQNNGNNKMIINLYEAKLSNEM